MVACPKALIDSISVINVVTLHRNLPEQQRPSLTKLWPGSDICCVAVKAVRTVEGRHTREPSCLTSGAKIIFSFDHLLKMENQSRKPPHVGKSQELSYQFRSLVTASRLDQPVLSWTILKSLPSSSDLWCYDFTVWFYCWFIAVCLGTACSHKFGYFHIAAAWRFCTALSI